MFTGGLIQNNPGLHKAERDYSYLLKTKRLQNRSIIEPDWYQEA